MRSVADLMRDAEKADDDYRDAVLAAASVKADYELAYYKSLAQSSHIKSVAGREAQADIDAAEEHRLLVIAEAREKAAKTHVQVMLGLLVAAQSQQKHARSLDGGDF